MRPLVRFGALSAYVVAIALLGSACTADTTIGADAPETSEETTDQDRGVAVDPLPTVTPTAVPESEATSIPGPTPTPTPEPAAPGIFERDPDLDGDGRITSEEQAIADGEYPAIWMTPVSARIGDVVPVDLASQPIRRHNTFSTGERLAPISTTQTTADGLHMWAPVIDALSSYRCAEGATTQLGIEPIDRPSPANKAEPTTELPRNISAIHHGPGDRVLFYTTCDGVTRPAAFATALADGNFTDVQPVDELFEATTEALPPRWGWGATDALPSPYDPVTLLAVIPQRGVTRTGFTPGGTGDVYVDAATGNIVDVFPGPLQQQAGSAWNSLETDGETVRFAGVEIDMLGDPAEIVVARPARGPGAPARILVGGRGGAVIFGENRGPISIDRLGDRPVAAAAWAPIGPWLALTGPGAGTWLYNDGETIELAGVGGGEAIYFSPDGTKLVVAAHDGNQVYEWARLDPPSDATRVTAFSTFDSGGLGPIRVEMLLSELRAELDMEFRMFDDFGTEPGSCANITSPDVPGVWIMAERLSADDAVVTAVVVDEGPWITPSGLRIGSTEAEVYDALGDQLDVTGHKYIDGNYLTFVPSDPADTFSIKFETNRHQVFGMHAGRQDWISLVEGCA